MENYRCLIVISKPVRTVYDALTTAKGIQNWWTQTCEVGARVGTICIFRFGKTYSVMQIEKLERDSEVRWRCLEQYIHAPELARCNEWVGSKVRFRLTATSPETSLLDFEHVGLTPKLHCYSLSQDGWDHFLKRSLKAYVETGEGHPFKIDPAM